MKRDNFNFIAAIVIILASIFGYAYRAISPSFYALTENAGIEVSAEPDEEESMEQNNGLVNINFADESELQALEGIGEKKAKGIVQYREQNGSFESIEEIKNVAGIGDKIFEMIKDCITVER